MSRIVMPLLLCISLCEVFSVGYATGLDRHDDGISHRAFVLYCLSETPGSNLHDSEPSQNMLRESYKTGFSDVSLTQI